MKVDKVIDKDPDRAEFLLRGLFTEPRSRYRAEYLKRHPIPQAAGGGDRVLGWHDWSPTLAVMVAIYNHLLVRDGGKGAQNKTLKPPSSRMIISAADPTAMKRAMGV